MVLRYTSLRYVAKATTIRPMGYDTRAMLATKTNYQLSIINYQFS